MAYQTLAGQYLGSFQTITQRIAATQPAPYSGAAFAKKMTVQQARMAAAAKMPGYSGTPILGPLPAPQPVAIPFHNGQPIRPVRPPAFGLKTPVDRPLLRPVMRQVHGLSAVDDPALPPPNTLKTVLILLAIPLAFIITGKE